MVLPRHRAEPTHLPEQPLHDLDAAVQILRQELTGLLREVLEDCPRLEHTDRLAAADGGIVDDRRDPVIGRDPQELGPELRAFADMTGTIRYGRPASSRKMVILCPFGVVQ